MAANTRITVYLEPRDKKAIDKAAKAHGEHASEFLRRLAKEHLAEDESLKVSK